MKIYTIRSDLLKLPDAILIALSPVCLTGGYNSLLEDLLTIDNLFSNSKAFNHALMLWFRNLDTMH